MPGYHMTTPYMAESFKLQSVFKEVLYAHTSAGCFSKGCETFSERMSSV